jgi:hypothetical protein
MGASLLAIKCEPQRPVWSGQFRKSNVAGQSFRVRRCHRQREIGLDARYGKLRAPGLQRVQSSTYDCLLAVEIDNIYCRR